ncbi:NlpC/P60 family protein [Paenibacillus allorhizosphaerae]|uniref:NlpC/P60 domain-containing protein n=1 Tax=Paenibacillus allorhizosphaerae TaxID=2849866 RepID=A0ABN7TI64_9BACL|nr:C40 family peptidase [Paenibacillus allorhizosphaerae]CAG7631352.1 hypothetical protein PAECIP111802_01735 [Paenibacillus allorhizosphaerae]
MRNVWRRSALMLLSAAIIVVSGCGPQVSQEQQQSKQQGIPSTNGYAADRQKSENLNGGMANGSSEANPGTLRVQSTQDEVTIPLVTIGGKDYVIGSDFAHSLEYNYQWNAGSNVFQIGENDATVELKIGSTNALKEEVPVTLSDPPILQNSQVHIPVSAIATLFSEEIAYELRGKNMVVRGTDIAAIGAIDGPEEANTGSELDFEDDPNDPFKGDEGTDPLEAPTANYLDEPAIPVIKNIDMNALIRQGKRYLGIDYLFGADPYPQSGRFDCSRYTQYLFGKQNVKLNRLARSQAKQGVFVPRKSLRKGDLMFFYVPGRFRTNRTVGHVGIYMGNQKMIHSSPLPKNGVQITNINKAYWKRTYLQARRVAY